jgi:hypothetical protein
MTPEELEGVLRDAASSPAPAPRPAFTDALELRLRSLDTSVRPFEARRPRPLRRAAPAAMALLVAAALLAVALLPQGTKARIEQVPSTIAAEPTTEVTTTSVVSTSTSTSTSTTVVSGPVVTVRREPAPTTSTTAVEQRATTTTTALEPPPRPTTTTTTAPEGVQNLELSCVASGGSTAPVITCRWGRTTSDRFASYRLIRHTGDGPEQVVSTGADRGPTSVNDPAARFGARLYYVVTALAADGSVLGRSETPLVSCC